MWPFLGTVFSDSNGDGVRQVDEPGVAGAVVAYERSLYTTTDAEGRYVIDAPGAGLVWVRVPDGFRPGAVWRRAELTSTNVDLALVPLTPAELASPLTFIVASDSHTTNDPTDKWDGGNLVDALEQATALPEPPRFFTIVGDITQANRTEEFQRVAAAVKTIEVPWVPVAGNHDWYDGGANYRGYFGVDNYSFDIGDVHFTVWDTNLSEDDQLAFFAADLARVRAGMTVIGLGHASPSDRVADALGGFGVDYLFTGHWHSNRRLARGSMTEWGTQTFIMGGIDQSPSGYRVVTIVGGEVLVEHRERLVHSHFEPISPRPGTCASPAGFPILAAAAFNATTPDVLVRIDCGAPLPLAATGHLRRPAQLRALPLRAGRLRCLAGRHRRHRMDRRTRRSPARARGRRRTRTVGDPARRADRQCARPRRRCARGRDLRWHRAPARTDDAAPRSSRPGGRVPDDIARNACNQRLHHQHRAQPPARRPVRRDRTPTTTS